MRLVGVALVFFMIGVGSTVSADEAAGRRHWEKGKALYARGKFVEAAKAFEAGYVQAPRSAFLLNIGHAYRRAGELTKARTAYEQLLRLDPTYAGRAEIQHTIKSIDDALQAPAQPPRPETPAAEPSPEPVPVLVDPTPSPKLDIPEPAAPAANPFITATASSPDEPESPSLFRRPWFWVVVGTVVAGGVTAALLATRPGSASSCPGTACFKER